MSSRAALPPPLATIVGAGARAACGLTPLQVMTGVRAGKLEPRVSHMVDRAGEPIATARLACIADNVMGLDRFAALGGPALRQAALPWSESESAARREPVPFPVIVALPAPERPGLDPRLREGLWKRLEERSGLTIAHDRSKLVFGCRAGGVEAVAAAARLLKDGAAEVVLAGGIDSYFDPDVLEHLDRELRLHSLTAENGFIPGEGAGFVALTLRQRPGGPRKLGGVLSAAVEREPRPYGSEEPCLAAGMTRAVKQALEALGTSSQRIDWLMTDVVDERHRVDEWAFVTPRVAGALAPEPVHDQPLLITGDLGAASVGVMMAIAVTRWDTECAQGDLLLLAAHSDGPGRGAMLLRAP